MKWISVDDRLPEEHEQPCLVSCNDGAWWNQYVAWTDEMNNDGFILSFPYEAEYEGILSKDIPLTNVTHWMPLPEPPKEKP